MKKFKGIFLIIACIVLIVYRVIEAQTAEYVSFRVYALPIALVLAIIFVLIEKKIIPSKEYTSVEVYEVNQLGKLTQKLVVLSDNEAKDIVDILSIRYRNFNIDRNFKYSNRAIKINSSKKTVTLFLGSDDMGMQNVKVNNIYFSIKELSENELKLIKEIANRA